MTLVRRVARWFSDHYFLINVVGVGLLIVTSRNWPFAAIAMAVLVLAAEVHLSRRTNAQLLAVLAGLAVKKS